MVRGSWAVEERPVRRSKRVFWVSADGEKTLIDDMDEQHAKNALAFIVEQAEVTKGHWRMIGGGRMRLYT